MLRLVPLSLMLIIFSCINKEHTSLQTNISPDTSLKIISTGLTDLETITQLDSLSKKYGFKYYPIGCVVNPQLMDSVENENKISYEILEKRNGKYWRKNFNSQYDRVSKIRVLADSIVKAGFPQNNKYYHYLVMADQQENSYRVRVYSSESLNGKEELIVHYKMVIVLGKRGKVLIKETFEKL